MSADLLALAARAADAYARVKGPWLRRTGLEAYPDPISPHELVVRAFNADGRRDSGLVIFVPFPRKEIPMPTPPPPLVEQPFDNDVWDLVSDLKKRVEELELWRDVVEHGPVRR